MRHHADGLAKKDYAKAVGGAVEFVVLFVPGENFLSAAVEHDRALIDFFKRQVVLAGPVNLVAVAKTVALRCATRHGWPRKPPKSPSWGAIFTNRIASWAAFVGVGRNLAQTVSSYNAWSARWMAMC